MTRRERFQNATICFSTGWTIRPATGDACAAFGQLRRTQAPSRSDDVWRASRRELETKQVLSRLQPKRIKPAYTKALNILNKMPVKKDFVTEQEAAKFSQELADEMAKHPATS